MFLGRVIGRVWSSAKDPKLEGLRFLVVQPLTPELKETGKRLICADASGAGAGELIYWVRGREACFPFLPKEVACDATVVGIVDEVHVARPPRPSSAPPPKSFRKGRPC